MYPATIVLKDELSESYLPLALHLLYEFEQTAVIGPVARNDVGSTSEDVVAVLCSTYKCIELLAAVA